MVALSFLKKSLGTDTANCPPNIHSPNFLTNRTLLFAQRSKVPSYKNFISQASL